MPNELQQRIQAFVRDFGLLEKDQTPCGRPIPTSQAHAIQVLGQEGALPQQLLADRLQLDKSTISRLVSHLVDQGWVVRTVNPEDRRESRLSLTDRGWEIFTEVSEAAAGKFADLWERIPAGKREQVLESLSLLSKALKER